VQIWVLCLLLRGVGIDHYTEDDKTPLDLACDAGNWEAFEILAAALDDMQRLRRPSFRCLSKFMTQLRDPFEEHTQHLDASQLAEMYDNAVSLRESGKLHTLVPYPDENPVLVRKLPY
jgi:hypothetical protein